ELPKEELLQYEKEVLGIYLSGHPIEEYRKLWETHITNTTADFKVAVTEGVEDGNPGDPAEIPLDINFNPISEGTDAGTEQIEKLHGDQRVTIGGIIEECKIKYTKNDKIMAFVTLEDMLGSVEVIVFPKSYEQYRDCLVENEKVFISGRVSEEIDRDMKLICDKIERFSDKPSTLWIRFSDQAEADASSADLDAILHDSDGHSIVKEYIKADEKIVTLPASMSVGINRELLERLYGRFGRDNIEVTYPKK
ncbi:MAG: hypothetical protein K5673_10960, partial [Lachnospiraceae bacterium]|nr:hypothetical protein [Lachnospiraceae bacterium]